MKQYPVTFTSVKATVLSLSVLSAGAVQASPMGVDLSLSDESANFALFSKVESPLGSTRYSADYFYNEPGDRFYSVSGNIQRRGMAGEPNLDLGLKGKGYFFTQDDHDLDGFGLMLGVTAEYWLPTQSPASLSVEMLHSPEIVTSGDADSMTEVLVRANMQLLPSVTGYIGYRSLTADFESDSGYEFDDNWHLGVELTIN